MLSFNIHEINIFIRFEYHNRLLIRNCIGLSGRMDKTKRNVGLLQEKVSACAPVQVPLLSLIFYSNNFRKYHIVESERKNHFTRNRNVDGILEN